MTAPPSPAVLVGPMLRFVGETEATVWVQTSAPCEVEVLGARSRTFTVADQHYALVCVEGPRGRRGVRVRGAPRRAAGVAGAGVAVPAEPDPHAGAHGGPVADRFGSCRLVAPHEPPYVLPQTQHEKGRGLDALRVYATALVEASPQTWPNLLLLLGDQLYSDDLSPEMERVTRSARDGDGPPADELLTFPEFALAYRESWTDPMVRWLFSTIPTAMVFDDHEVRDAWKSSQAWLEEMRTQGWYDERVCSALSAYWLYQHLETCPRPSCATTPCSPTSGKPRTAGRCCVTSPCKPTGSPDTAAGASRAGSGRRGWWSSTPAQAGCSPPAPGAWWNRDSGTGSTPRSTARTDTCCSPAPCRS